MIFRKRYNRKERKRQEKLGPIADFEHCCSKEFPTFSQIEILPDGTISKDYPVIWSIALKHPIRYIYKNKKIWHFFIFLGYFELLFSILAQLIWMFIAASFVIFQLWYITPSLKLLNTLESGITNFNNGDYEKAIETFLFVQTKRKDIAFELNDLVLLCLIKLQRFNEALEYIDTHEVSAKPAKKMTIYSETNRLDDAINLFFEAYGDQIEQYPLSLIFPAKMIEYRKNTEAAIEFLDKHYIENTDINKNNFTLFKYYLELCNKINLTDKIQKINARINEYKLFSTHPPFQY